MSVIRNCNVCNSSEIRLLAKSEDQHSITSTVRIMPGQVEIFFCEACSHVMTAPLPQLKRYYSDEYNILTDSEEQDQFYGLVDGKPTYRFDHQAKTWLSIVEPTKGASVLDYGSAKGATLRKALADRPDLRVFLFDVSDSYRVFWREFLPEAQTASHELPKEWLGTFDYVTSFYALEHVENPLHMLQRVFDLLKPGGKFYFIVPNVAANHADLIVADHINHFSISSIQQLVRESGLSLISIDSSAHQSAFVCVAEKSRSKEIGKIPPFDREEFKMRIFKYADFWMSAEKKVRDFEASLQAQESVAIYGAGFYGTFIAKSLVSPDRIACFVDQDAYKRSRPHMGHSVLSPSELPAKTSAVMVGINPHLAKNIISGIPEWASKDLKFFYL